MFMMAQISHLLYLRWGLLSFLIAIRLATILSRDTLNCLTLDIRKYSFSQRTINEWNKLSTDCVTASSMNMFKNKVDTYLRRVGYTQVKNYT